MVYQQENVNRPNISKRQFTKKLEYVADVSVYKSTQSVHTGDQMRVTIKFPSSHKNGNIVINITSNRRKNFCS